MAEKLSAGMLSLLPKKVMESTSKIIESTIYFLKLPVNLDFFKPTLFYSVSFVNLYFCKPSILIDSIKCDF